MAAQWQRWLRYAKAKVDATVRDGEREMDRLEAERAAATEGKPWLSSSGDAPTLDEVRARIEEGSRSSGTAAPADGGSGAGGGEDAVAVELAARERAAAERLAAIREELGLDGPAAADGPGVADGPAAADEPPPAAS